MSTLDAALALAQKPGSRYQEAELYRIKGKLLLARWPSENEAVTTDSVALSTLHESRIVKPDPIPLNQALSNSYG